MSAEPILADGDLGDDGRARCWCCGSIDAADRMIRLGDHPEVRLCLRCAHFVHHRAWEIEDEGKVGLVAFARNRFRNVRAQVMRRGWHQNRFIGRHLRWLGRHLP